MKKDLSIIAKELFPDLNKITYEQLLNRYRTDGKTDINPTISFFEAINKYRKFVLSVMEDKDNWKFDGKHIFVNFHNFTELFDEFFPIYKTEDGIPYFDMGAWNYMNGKEIVSLLITEIFYLNYFGMDIKNIYFPREGFLDPEHVCIVLRLSNIK